eukprot:3288058-Pleurochrysis_carterae.AAC.1
MLSRGFKARAKRTHTHTRARAHAKDALSDLVGGGGGSRFSRVAHAGGRVVLHGSRGGLGMGLGRDAMEGSA